MPIDNFFSFQKIEQNLNDKPVFSGEEFNACSMTTVHGVGEGRILVNISRVGLHSQLQQYLHTVIFTCCSGPVKRGPDRKTDIMLYNNKEHGGVGLMVKNMTSL